MLSLTILLLVLVKALFVVLLALAFVPFLVWLERKGSAIIQDRVGPNRAAIGFVRLGGLVHLLADSLKMLSKEDLIPREVDRFYYYLAPFLVAMVSLMLLAVMPFADQQWGVPMQVLTLNAGVIYILSIASLNVYGIVLAGWSSSNKFALLGGLRSSAQLVSYEIPMGLALVGALMVYNTVQLNEIVVAQGQVVLGFLPAWGIWYQPLGAILFTICAFAETNRTPFDLAEGESELVAGYHTEYAGMKFGLFFLAEYVAMVASSALIVTLYFGGWQVPYFTTEGLIAHAALLFTIACLAAVPLLIWLAIAFHQSYLRNLGRFKDIRDQEGHIYSRLCWGLMMVALLAAVAAALLPWPVWLAQAFALVAQIGCFLVKILLMCAFFIWVRWTLPRFRYDQLMQLSWRTLLPLALLNILLTGAMILAKA